MTRSGSFSAGLVQLSSVDARIVEWFAVVLVGGVRVSLHDGWRAVLVGIACATVGGSGATSSLG